MLIRASPLAPCWMPSFAAEANRATSTFQGTAGGPVRLCRWRISNETWESVIREAWLEVLLVDVALSPDERPGILIVARDEASTWALSWPMAWNEAPLSDQRLRRIENQISIWLGQDARVGV